MIKQLATIEDVISELGGAKAVAKLTGRQSVSAIPMWKIRRKFPLATYARMQAALRARGAAAPDELWGMQ